MVLGSVQVLCGCSEGSVWVLLILNKRVRTTAFGICCSFVINMDVTSSHRFLSIIQNKLPASSTIRTFFKIKADIRINRNETNRLEGGGHVMPESK